MLCVATPNPDSPAETFVRQHIRMIAPGETVVVYFHGEGRCLDGVPSLRAPRPQDLPAAESWVRRGLSYLAHSNPGAIAGRLAAPVEEFFRQHGVTAVLAEFGSMGSALLPICWKLRLPLVVNFHGQDAAVLGHRPATRRAYRKLNAFAEGIVCGSAYFSGILAGLGFDRQKISIVPCGIEVDDFRRAEDRDPDLILAVGRFVEKKAPHLTIQAFAEVARVLPGVRMEMIGDGPLLGACRELAAGWGLSDRLVFHGAREHDFVKRKFSQAGLFVQHSVVAANGDMESQGISLLEAMASMLPVVTTRHNGFTEVVEDGVTGFLVEEGDVKEMANRMIALLRDSDLREGMGLEGLRRVRARYEAKDQARKLNKMLFGDQDQQISGEQTA